MLVIFVNTSTGVAPINEGSCLRVKIDVIMTSSAEESLGRVLGAQVRREEKFMDIQCYAHHRRGKKKKYHSQPEDHCHTTVIVSVTGTPEAIHTPLVGCLNHIFQRANRYSKKARWLPAPNFQTEHKANSLSVSHAAHRKETC